MTVPLQSSAVEARGLSGRIFWTDGTPPPSPGAVPVNAGPAYVLIHGIGASHRYLRRLHHLLAATAPTYSMDLPGFGGTPRPARQLSVEDYGAFIAETLESSGIESYILVGHSMGVQFTIEAARHAPDRVRQLVLMGPVVDERHRTVTRQGVALLLDALLRESAASNWTVMSDYFRCGPRWYFTEVPVMMDYPTEKCVAGIDIPVLVLRGGQDQVAGPEWSRRLSAAAPHGHFVEIPGAGHVVQHLRSRQVADAISTFVDSTAGQARR